MMDDDGLVNGERWTVNDGWQTMILAVEERERTISQTNFGKFIGRSLRFSRFGSLEFANSLIFAAVHLKRFDCARLIGGPDDPGR